MKVVNNKASELERVEWTHDLFNFSTQKVPCESNCPYMVVTDTIELPKRIGRLSGHGRSTGKRQMSVLAPQRPGNKVIHAEGEVRAAEKLAQAANITGVYPPAINLRFL